MPDLNVTIVLQMMIKRFTEFKTSLQGQQQFSLTLLDQVLVSGVNFLTGIILARQLGLTEFGFFSFAYMLIQFTNTLQSGLILFPMMSIGPKYSDAEASVYFGALFIKQFLFSVSLFILVLLLSWSNQSFLPQLHLYEVALPLALTVVAVQCQDFIRRYFFTIGTPLAALINDAISYLGQIIVLSIACIVFPLHTGEVLWIISGTSCLAILFGLFSIQKITLSQSVFLSTLKQHWHVGSWLTFSSLVQWCGSQGSLLIAGTLLGPATLGGIRVIINLIAPINIFIFGLQNIIPVRASQFYKDKGQAGLVCYLTQVTWALVFGIGTIIFLVTIFNQELLLFLYGKTYSTFSQFVIWQGFYVFLGALVFPFTIYFRTVEKTKTIGIAVFVATFVALFSLFMLIDQLKTLAVFISLIINQALILLISSAGYFYTRPKAALLPGDQPCDVLSKHSI